MMELIGPVRVLDTLKHMMVGVTHFPRWFMAIVPQAQLVSRIFPTDGFTVAEIGEHIKCPIHD